MTLIINHSQLKQCIELCSDLITVATDGADLDLTDLEKAKKEFYGIYDEIYGEFLRGITTDHTLELNQKEKERIFNLGYYTWVEQQGVDLNDFEKRRDQQFWRDHYNHMLSLDDRIEEFNAL